jgi:hypothetical protein
VSRGLSGRTRLMVVLENGFGSFGSPGHSSGSLDPGRPGLRRRSEGRSGWSLCGAWRPWLWVAGSAAPDRWAGREARISVGREHLRPCGSRGRWRPSCGRPSPSMCSADAGRSSTSRTPVDSLRWDLAFAPGRVGSGCRPAGACVSGRARRDGFGGGVDLIYFRRRERASCRAARRSLRPLQVRLPAGEGVLTGAERRMGKWIRSTAASGSLRNRRRRSSPRSSSAPSSPRGHAGAGSSRRRQIQAWARGRPPLLRQGTAPPGDGATLTEPRAPLLVELPQMYRNGPLVWVPSEARLLRGDSRTMLPPSGGEKSAIGLSPNRHSRPKPPSTFEEPHSCA